MPAANSHDCTYGNGFDPRVMVVYKTIEINVKDEM